MLRRQKVNATTREQLHLALNTGIEVQVRHLARFFDHWRLVLHLCWNVQHQKMLHFVQKQCMRLSEESYHLRDQLKTTTEELISMRVRLAVKEFTDEEISPFSV